MNRRARTSARTVTRAREAAASSRRRCGASTRARCGRGQRCGTSCGPASTANAAPAPPSLLAYAPEPQQRGAIHFHIVFGAGSPRERAALDDIAHDLATIGAGYGWGRVHLPDADEARNAARRPHRPRPRALRSGPCRLLPEQVPQRRSQVGRSRARRQRPGANARGVRGDAPDDAHAAARCATSAPGATPSWSTACDCRCSTWSRGSVTTGCAACGRTASDTRARCGRQLVAEDD